jgi:uncharacterized protein YndB with AHSA1/START domain
MTMKKPDYVYVSYIAATADKVWQAIVDPEVTRKYWGDASGGCCRVNVSDWQPGSRWEHRRADPSAEVDIVGRVVESNPPRRLVITWARPSEIADESKHSRVSFDIEPYVDGMVRLTVTHDELAHDPKMLESISGGWPKVLSNLKTLLETGRGLAHAA